MVFGWPWKDVRVLSELDGERSTFGRQKSIVIQLGDGDCWGFGSKNFPCF